MRKIPALFFFVAAAASQAQAITESDARLAFSRYQALEQAFDPAIADLYCDSALIRNVRHYPTGQRRAMEFPAPQYKALIRAAMPTAKAKNDFSTYSDVRFIVEDHGVRIIATRFSNTKRYSSPISILVGPCPGRSVGILEELSQSRP